MKKCIICNKEYEGRSNHSTCCSIECSKLHYLTYQKLYAFSPKRKKYIKAYRKSNTCKESVKKYQQSIQGKVAKKKSRINYNKTIMGKKIKLIQYWKRRAMKNNITETYTLDEFLNKAKECGGICPSCNKPFNVNIKENKLTIDHVYPISKANEDFKVTGIKRVYTIKDINPLCMLCNSKKRDKIIEPKDLNTEAILTD